MHDLEYYGFSLLCRVQQSCNARFREGPDFFELSSGKILDFSGLSAGVCSAEVAEKDLVGRLLGGEFSQKVLDCLCEACKQAGVAARLYKLSQWTPDRKRSALIMYRGGRTSTSGEARSGACREWLAVSLGDRELDRVYAYGGIDRLNELKSSSGVISDHEIWVSSLECQEICLSFMSLARKEGLFD